MKLIELGKAPVPGNSPAGSDIRGEEIFEKLSSEIEKMSSPSSAGGIDWQEVLDICVDILQNHSKDLLVASYLSLALTKTEGMLGLAKGIAIWRDVTTTYWDTLFPSKARMRGRRNAIDWWIEKTSSTIAGLEPQHWKKNDIDILLGNLGAIESFLSENMDDAPMMAPLMSMIGTLLIEEGAKTEEAQPREAQPGPAGAPARETKAAAPAPMEPVPSGDDPGPVIKHAVDTLRAASDILIQKDMLEGLFFRINRVIAWMTVTDIPPNQGGMTMIEAPEGQIRDSLNSMHKSGSWRNLLMACESRIPQYLFWLDLSRYVAEALEQTGKKAVADEVTGATLLYVKRLPGIERLSFSDGTPFADSDTKQWLESAGKGDQDTSSAGPSTQELFHTIEEETNEARAAAKGGNLAGAIKTLKDRIIGAPSAQERFIRQIWFCRFLFQNDQWRLFSSYSSDLVALIDTYRVEEWEPSLAAQAYGTILTGIRSANSSEYEDMGRNIFQRLSLLDPVKAMNYI